MNEIAIPNDPLETSPTLPEPTPDKAKSSSPISKIFNGLGYALLLVIIFNLSQFTSLPIIIPASFFEKNIPQLKTLAIFIAQLLSAACFIFMLKSRSKDKQALPLGSISWRLTGWTTGFFLGFLILEIASISTVYNLWGPFATPEIPGHGFPLFLILVIGAPLSEELLFRAFGVQWLKGKFSPKMAVFFTALAFSLAHVYLIKLPGTFALGLFLGWLFLRTGSLRLSLLIHALNNAIGFLALTLCPNAEETMPWPWVFGLAALGAPLAWAMWKGLKAKMDQEFPFVSKDETCKQAASEPEYTLS